ncbi:c-type cytochrome [Sulfuriflexus sp.]|uniref:c-type cytochrome n=1 Tax=Sulfuriflexus sp. TaxID=2015443 RepID=UPI0028CC744B|nr:c-type cytochrome [Sulfuriflexus sp.]MDT8404819.1 c-type cytochrome [Sulfuriflexus sp.]
MMKRIATAAILLGMVSTAWAAGDPVAGQQKAALCIGCHGVDGNSNNPDWPSLAGQHAEYLTKQISDFKSQARKDPTMNAMVASLSGTDIANIAAFFASNKAKVTGAQKESIELGRDIYRGGIAERGVAACASCHGPSGAGNPAASFPAVSGQHAKYTAKALNDFASGARSNDPQSMMRDVAGKLKAKEIQAVAEYIAGLH